MGCFWIAQNNLDIKGIAVCLKTLRRADMHPTKSCRSIFSCLLFTWLTKKKKCYIKILFLKNNGFNLRSEAKQQELKAAEHFWDNTRLQFQISSEANIAPSWQKSQPALCLCPFFLNDCDIDKKDFPQYLVYIVFIEVSVAIRKMSFFLCKFLK